MSELLGMAQWLKDAGLDSGVPSSLYPETARAGLPATDFDLAEVTEAAQRLEITGVAVPLVATRAHLVANGQLAGLRLAYDGTPLWDRAGWALVAADQPPAAGLQP
jgi:hypothetical protein